jgi:5'-3' exonuclease
MKQKTILLMDADIFAFQVASSVESEVDWGDDLWTLDSDLGEAIETFRSRIKSVQIDLDADQVLLCFTGSKNFRKAVYPGYKLNRAPKRKPLVYKALVAHCKEHYDAITIEGLEADDVMGIIATSDSYYPDMKKVIVSEDKDLKTIGGAWLYNPKKDTKPTFNEPQEAYRYFLEQTLTGDPTDGYGGCPGIGADTAKALLEEPHGWELYEHTFKSGPRKDTSELRWRKREVESVWQAIVDHYIKAGLCEEAALQQARCARILHASDFDHTTKEPILWLPPKTASTSST